jgi:thioredoxin 1
MGIKTARANRVRSLGDDDIETVLEEGGVTLVEFYTEWCGTCDQMEPVLETLADDTDATILTVDIESNLETAIEFGAQSTPTFVLFADGQPVKQLRGGQNEQTLRGLVARYNS